MTADTFECVIQSLGALSELREVVLGGYGEPLLWPPFLDGVERLKGLGVKLSISTNGTLLDAERAEALVRLGVDTITVSLDGVAPDIFAEIREGAELQTVLSNLEGLNRAKKTHRSPLPRLDIEFVAMKSNLAELAALPTLARRLTANRVLISHLLPHTPEMVTETLYRRDETPPLSSPVAWPVPSGDWLLWGTMELPRMNWGASRRCRFIANNALVIGWDGAVSPCYALLHSYPCYIFGRRKQVSRYTLGNVNKATLAAIWAMDEYVRFRAEVRRFNFPSCIDCNLRESCDLNEANESCWGLNPSCADCLWAQDIVRCP
ncbi:MAG: radical SAM protein [Chloroflexi bacterium]|nr:radical SAM protein [Chloroflexota bacterium]